MLSCVNFKLMYFRVQWSDFDSVLEVSEVCSRKPFIWNISMKKNRNCYIDIWWWLFISCSWNHASGLSWTDDCKKCSIISRYRFLVISLIWFPVSISEKWGPITLYDAIRHQTIQLIRSNYFSKLHRFFWNPGLSIKSVKKWFQMKMCFILC